MKLPTNEDCRFIILFQGRSGSTYFVEALDSHPRIRCDIERLVSLRKHGIDAQLRWIEELFNSSGNIEVSAVGFKTKLDDILGQESVAELLRGTGARVILLSRLNIVKMVVSWFNSERLFELTGNWNQYPPASRLQPFEIDLEKFDRRLGLVLHGKARLEAYVRGLGLPTIQVCYEDLLLNQRRVLRRVCDFLGVEPIPMQGQCVKATSDDLRKVITNFDALYNLYRGTHYQQMLDEVLITGNGAES